jgi:hypothetical protein
MTWDYTPEWWAGKDLEGADTGLFLCIPSLFAGGTGENIFIESC